MRNNAGQKDNNMRKNGSGLSDISDSMRPTSAGGADFLHPIAIAVGLRANNICVTSRGACAVTQTAIAKARDLCCRVSRRRALPWLAANLWGAVVAASYRRQL